MRAEGRVAYLDARCVCGYRAQAAGHITEGPVDARPLEMARARLLAKCARDSQIIARHGSLPTLNPVTARSRWKR